MSSQQYKVLGLSSIGGGLEFYEFVVFIYLTPLIAQSFFPATAPSWITQLQTLAIFSVGYLVRPIGGIALANLGDVIGRKRIFTITLLLMALPTAGIALLPGYEHIGVLAPILLLLCRILQGLALGGELPGAMVFVSEHISERNIGRSIGLLGAAVSTGAVCAALATGFVADMSRADALSYGWRLPFLFGGVFGICSAYLRPYVRETPVFEQMRARNNLAKELPIKVLLSQYPTEAILCIIACCASAAIVPSVFLYPPTYLQSVRGFTPSVAHSAATWAKVAGIAGCIVSGWLVDRLGPVRAVCLMVFLSIPTVYWVYLTVEPYPASVMTRFAILGFLFPFHIMLWLPVIRCFTPQTRYTGIAFGYNISAALLGGITPVLLAGLSHFVVLAPAHYAAFFAAVALTITPVIWKFRKPIS